MSDERANDRRGQRYISTASCCLWRSECPPAAFATPLSVILFFGCNHPLPAKSDAPRLAQGEKMNLEEASMNFDSENVRPFLERLKPMIEFGFSDNEISQVQKWMDGLKVDDEKELEFPIKYHGEKSVLRVRVFMDDVDSPNVYFFTHPQLAREISQEIGKFAEEHGL
jgi:hypothetical protein